MKSPNDFMLTPAHTEAEYQALAAELAAEHMAHSVTIAEEHESRTAFQERIATLEAALRGIIDGTGEHILSFYAPRALATARAALAKAGL